MKGELNILSVKEQSPVTPIERLAEDAAVMRSDRIDGVRYATKLAEINHISYKVHIRDGPVVAEILKAKPARGSPAAPAGPAASAPVAAPAAGAPPMSGSGVPAAPVEPAAPPSPAHADPLAAVAESIRTSLAAGRGADAARAFLGVVAQRTQLTLEPPVWEGLGRALLSALIAAARQRGLKEMEGFVLARNQPMLKLAARLGFDISPDPDGSGHAHLPLAPCRNLAWC